MPSEAEAAVACEGQTDHQGLVGSVAVQEPLPEEALTEVPGSSAPWPLEQQGWHLWRSVRLPLVRL